MKRALFFTLLCATLFLAFDGFAQDKTPTIRDEVRQKGFVLRSTYPEDRTLFTFEDLIKRSDLIFRGRVVDERTRLSGDEHDVWTDYTVEVLEVFKDAPKVAGPGRKLIVTTEGGNILVEGKPVRVDSPNFPPIPWIVPHIFFVRRSDNAEAEFNFTGAGIGVFLLDKGKLACGSKERSRHPATKSNCDKLEGEFVPLLKGEIAKLGN